MTTSLIPFNTQFGLMDDFRNEMNSLFDRFGDGDSGEERSQMKSWLPPLNLCETDDEYCISLDLPGVDPKDVDVEVRHGELWITGRRESDSEKQGRTWHRRERFYGEFRRVVRLGMDVDTDRIDAKFKDGVLQITVGKTEDAKTKKIRVKS